MGAHREVPRPTIFLRSLLCFLCTVPVVFGAFSCPNALADLDLLAEQIAAYNAESGKRSLKQGRYAGREGILMLLPGAARDLGLRTLEDDVYREARELMRRARRSREACVEAMKSTDRETRPGEHAERVGRYALEYLELRGKALELFREYRAGLSPDVDQRLDPGACKALLYDLLEASLQKARGNLRNALGLFYDASRGMQNSQGPLSPANVGFVNHVFNAFLRNAEPGALARYDLDRHDWARAASRGGSWKLAVTGRGARFAGLVERILRKYTAESGLAVDPLLFLALMKQESRFDPRAVSNVGAAGLTQIMPRTAVGLGMRNIFLPAYFEHAGDLLAREGRLRAKALRLIDGMTPENMRTRALRARTLMQESLAVRRKRAELYERYRRELLTRAKDDRLDPEKAVSYGLRYFAAQLKRQKGDISLALAAYNAGPHRVNRYGGIPPFEETVCFRNSVLAFYRGYLLRVTGTRRLR